MILQNFAAARIAQSVLNDKGLKESSPIQDLYHSMRACNLDSSQILTAIIPRYEQVPVALMRATGEMFVLGHH